MLSNLLTSRKRQRHVISKTWSLLSSSFFTVQDSAPYSSNERMSVWYNCILVWLKICCWVIGRLSPLSWFWFWCHLYLFHCLLCPLCIQNLPPVVYINAEVKLFLPYDLYFCFGNVDPEDIVTAGFIDLVYKGLKFPWSFRNEDDIVCKSLIVDLFSLCAGSYLDIIQGHEHHLFQEDVEQLGEIKYPCLTPTAVLNHSVSSPFTMTALWDWL